MSTPPGWPPEGGQHPPYPQQPYQQPYPPPGYPPQQYQQPYPHEPWQAYPQYQPYPLLPAAPPAGPGMNGMALASLVTAGMGVLTVILVPITSILAVVFGHKALKEIERTGESGRTMAVIGLWVGYAMLALIALGVVAIIIAVAAS